MKVTKLFIDETIHNDAESLEVSVMDNEVIAVGEVEMASSEIKIRIWYREI